MTRRFSVRLFVLASSSVLAWGAAPLAAQTVVPQTAPTIDLTQGSGPDNMSVLFAAAGERLSTMQVQSYGSPYHDLIRGFDASNEYIDWAVSAPVSTTYQLTALLLTSAANQVFRVTVDGGSPQTFTKPATGWERTTWGTISIPAGQHRIRISRDTLAGGVEMQSLELLKTSEVPAYNTRLAAAKSPVNHLQGKKYGVMYQYGHWGYPQAGGKKSIDAQAADFNVPAFVSSVKSMGAQYVIWSLTWITWEMNAPSPEADAIVGNGFHTSTRDLVGDIAQALKAEGIDFYLYYHLGYHDPEWWPPQQWPSTYEHQGYGDRSVAWNNWKSLISGFGNRLGRNLDGWFFDDATVYYANVAESLLPAIRAGNANRTTAFNNYVWATMTEFADTGFDEVCAPGNSPLGGNGVTISGNLKGIYNHCMLRMENTWGISQPSQPIGAPSFTVDQANAWVRETGSRGFPSAFNLMMYENGTMSPSSVAVLQGVKSRVFGTSCGTNCLRGNNDSPGVTYTGSWGHSVTRGVGDYSNDVHYTQTNNDASTIRFTGTGVRVYMPKGPVYGDFEVILDGVSQGTFNATIASGYSPNQLVYSTTGLTNAPHSVVLKKLNGQYMQLDAFEYDSAETCGVGCTRVNNNGSGITYSGTWGYSGARGGGDFGDDVQYAAANGASASMSFSGTAFRLYAPRHSSYGNFEVRIDGVLKGTFNAVEPTGYLPRELMYTITGLSNAPHTVTITKTSGAHMQIDYFEYDQ